MKKLNITFCSFPDFANNAKSLYEYMIKNYQDNMNYTWIVYNEASVKLLSEKGIKAILIGTTEFENYIKTTDIFFTTHANLTGDKVKTKNAIYVELWHGIGIKPVGFLANNLSDKDIDWYNHLKKTIDYMIVPSELWRSLMSAMFNMNAQRILALGLPVLDEIKFSDGKTNLSKILKTDVNKYNKIIMYMPTFKKGCGRELEANYNKNNILNFNDYSDSQLIRYLEENNYLLVIKRHPSDECEYVQIENEFIKNIDNKELENRGLNVNDILNAGDLLITDYSSVGIEFSFLAKPVIYIATDLEEYKRNRGILLNDYDFWTEGEYCYSYKELINKINENIDKVKEHSNKKHLFSSLSDGGCAQICNFLFDGNKLRKGIKSFKHPETILENKIKELEIEENNLKEKSEKEISDLKKELAKKNHEIEAVYSSKSWKIAMFLRKLMGKK